MTPAFRASEANRLLKEPLLAEAFAELERAALEEALRVPWWRPWGQAKRNALLMRVQVVRDLRQRLRNQIVIGGGSSSR